MANRDEFTRALAHIWKRPLAELGYRRVGTRNFKRLSNGILQLFNFQVSAGTFCINVAAFILCSNVHSVLQPGFRLRNANDSDMWLPSKPAEEALSSLEFAWKVAEAQALPWLERNGTIEGHLEVLRGESWASRHHLHFEIGVAQAMLGRRSGAIGDLVEASRLYAEDGRSWCPAYIARAEALIDALNRGNESELLEKWCNANLTAHGFKGLRG
ncbi:MAG: DUF4304 domain-containing protein [Micropepsaceae bacterium]